MEGPRFAIIETAPSGSLVDLLDPDPAALRLEDMAWALARIPRFTGHTLGEWPVASHLLLTDVIGRSLIPGANPALRLHWLLHDAHEAYIGDVSTPLKQALDREGGNGALQTIADRLDRRIYAALGLPMPTAAQYEAVKRADRIALFAEARVFVPSGARAWPWANPEVTDEPQIREAVRQIPLVPRGGRAGDHWMRRVSALRFLRTSGGLRRRPLHGGERTRKGACESRAGRPWRAEP